MGGIDGVGVDDCPSGVGSDCGNKECNNDDNDWDPVTDFTSFTAWLCVEETFELSCQLLSSRVDFKETCMI